MNDNEAEKIAGAINVVRPDWPTTSLLTLIRKNLMHRPRRDVFVALAWVASEAATTTPARVLELSGPWWKAAGIEGAVAERRTVSADNQCAECGQAKIVCTRIGSDHEFRPMSQGTRTGATPPADLIAQARAEIATVAAPIRQPVMDDKKCADANCNRGYGHTGPHQATAPHQTEAQGNDSNEEASAA